MLDGERVGRGPHASSRAGRGGGGDEMTRGDLRNVGVPLSPFAVVAILAEGVQRHFGP